MVVLYYNKSVAAVLQEFKTSEHGLHPTEVEERRKLYGWNVTKVKDIPLWRKLIEPFLDVFMLVLLVAAAISILHENKLDAIIILAIIVINAVIYYVQRFSADRVLRSLQKHNSQQVEVLRDNKITEVDSSELVPGDIIVLREGGKIPADCRLIKGIGVRVDESLLTGESIPIGKQVEALTGEKEVYEQSNMLFQGTFVVAGEATAVVVAIGNNTEFGQIAALAKNTETQSPVEQKTDKLIRQIIIVVICIALLAFILALIRGTELTEALRFVMALSVSAVPEGLPIAISIILAFGMSRMAAKKALIRNMQAIETVGVITTIATDKTGTLTKNKLTVQEVWQPKYSKKRLPDIIHRSVNHDAKKTHDPLDTAMIEYAAAEKAVELKGKPAKSLPFDQYFSMSGNVWRYKNIYHLAIKGAPEKILAKAHLSKSQQKEAEDVLANLTTQGYRVIALATAELNQSIEAFTDIHKKIVFEFAGFIAVADILRPEVHRAVAAALSAGVTVRMITGDHFETAYQISKQLGMAQNRNQVFDSRKMSAMTDKQLSKTIENIRVFSRVIPENKYRILSLLKRHDITAMTGDGVNDVPALTNAHIGVAMGSGSQIAKDASDIVLLNDNFKSIIDAMQEGRVIFANIRRMLYYLLATNAGEVLTMLGSLILGLPIPLMPVQILWVNLATDSALVVPLGLEPGEKGIMKQKPKSPNAPILNGFMISRMILVALSMAVITISLYASFSSHYGHEYGRTIAFSALVIMQWSNALNARSDHESFFSRIRVWNGKLAIGFVLAIILQALAIFGPFKDILHITPITVSDLVITSIISFIIPIILVESHKLIGRILKKTA